MLSRLDRYEEGYPHVSNFALLMFCGYVITWYLQIGYRIPALGAIRFEFIYAAVLTVVAMLFTPKPKLDCPVIKWVILLYLAMIIQIPFSYNVEHSWTIFIDRVVKFSFMGFFIVRFVQSPKGLILFIGAFLLACFKMGQEGFVGQITGNMVWQNQGVMRLHGSTPLYAHPNSFAGMALGSLCFIVFLYPLVKKFTKTIFFIHSVFVLNILLHSGSRTAYVAFVFFVIYFSIIKNKKFIACLFVLILFSVVSVYSGGQYFDRLESIYTLKDIEGNSIGKRKEIISDSIDVFLENPFGVGISAFPFAREARFGRVQDTHNLYLEVATNLGFQGLFIFSGFIISMIIVLKKIIAKMSRICCVLTAVAHDNSGINDKLLEVKFIIACASAVLMFLTIRIVLGAFGMDLYEIYWWFSFGLTMVLFEMSKRIENFTLSVNGIG